MIVCRKFDNGRIEVQWIRGDEVEVLHTTLDARCATQVARVLAAKLRLSLDQTSVLKVLEGVL